MARRTAVIDIGSNSARLVIFQKTSRYGFHLLCQHKSRVRIGEGAYHRNGYLQAEPMERAFLTLKSFKTILDDYRVHKTLCVATSALRDAPNRLEFIQRVRQDLQMDIQVIDGETEAQYGAIAVNNLLPVDDAITIDIGGGSSDIARIVSGRIVETISLNLGTVRIKELFTSDSVDRDKAKEFIDKELKRLPKSFRAKTVVGIGGSARSFAKALMAKHSYPFDKLHAYTYRIDDNLEFLRQIIYAERSDLRSLFIKEGRWDTIREGMLIFESLLDCVGASHVVTSGVGVREGVFLDDFLKKSQGRFPRDVNPSITSIRDRFDLLDLPVGDKHQMAKKLFTIFHHRFQGNEYDAKILLWALDLSDIGKMLTIYKEHQHAFYIAIHELNYGFTHEDMIYISLILRSKGKKYHKEFYRSYRGLSPKKSKLKWIVFIYTLVLILHENSAKTKINFSFDGTRLLLESDEGISYLVREQIDEMYLPGKIRIRIM